MNILAVKDQTSGKQPLTKGLVEVFQLVLEHRNDQEAQEIIGQLNRMYMQTTKVK